MDNSYSPYKASEQMFKAVKDLCTDLLPTPLSLPSNLVAKVMNDFRHGIVHNQERYELPRL